MKSPKLKVPASLALLVLGALVSRGKADTTHREVQIPAIAGKDFEITRFGAAADGTTPVTAAIQQAINEAVASGGGRVVIPKGVFISGPIVLASKIDLHLADGAILRMSDDRSLYPVTKNNRATFIAADKASDVRLSGNGTIDGDGESWWKTFLEEKAAGTKNAPRRPQMIAFKDCQRVEVEGIRTINPPNTHYSFKQCSDLTIRGIKAEAPDASPNTDAINLSSVRNVRISGCEISTGDDNIVLLCGQARNKGVPEVENVVIRDCKLGFGHGMSIGSYTSGGVRNVTVENVTFDGTTSGIRLKADRDRGGVVEGIRYRNISMKNVRYPIFITSYYPKPPENPAADLPFKGTPLLPVWRDILIEDVTVTDSKNSIVLWGLPERVIENITLKNVKISASVGASVFHARNVRFSNVEIVPAAGPPLRIHNAEVHGMAGVEQASERVKFK